MINRNTPPTIEEAWDMDAEDLYFVIRGLHDTADHALREPMINTRYLVGITRFQAELAEILMCKTGLENSIEETMNY